MAILEADKYQAMTSTTTQTRLDNEAVKSLLDALLRLGKITPEQVASCYKEISFEVLRVSRRDGQPAKEKWVAPTLGENMTPEGILDMLGDVREMKGDLEKEDKFLSEAFKARVAARESTVEEVKSELEQQQPQPSAPGQANGDTEAFSLWDNKTISGGSGSGSGT